MTIQLSSPCCLLLGMLPYQGQICRLGITLQYPPIQLDAAPGAGLNVTGGRADLAAVQAQRVLDHYSIAPADVIEIDLAVPSYMGLGSTPLMGMAMARTLAASHDLPTDRAALAEAAGLGVDTALEQYAFKEGGLLLVGEDGTLLRRATISHEDEANHWVWVLVLPRVPARTPETLEAERIHALRSAAEHMLPDASAVLDNGLWPALDADNYIGVAGALSSLYSLNEAVLGRNGALPPLSDAEQAVIDIMLHHGALVCGRALGGMSLYALVCGGPASRTLRRALATQLGYFGGTVTAALCDNTGAVTTLR